jgi:hypothetical protein
MIRAAENRHGQEPFLLQCHLAGGMSHHEFWENAVQRRRVCETCKRNATHIWSEAVSRHARGLKQRDDTHAVASIPLQKMKNEERRTEKRE